ncbi:GNAT family N-acetyltransferase [Nesterenkonia alba]|uniref:GNAT family N-acetyltransferase n=1 Tax=Nesterenkonia alba TaxID=515814 RepID=UPI0003B730D3|nr:GNAT family N-acetyltransferase [Nesterenkonia alba]
MNQPADPLQQARGEADAAAEAAGVVIRELRRPEQAQAAADLLAEIWSPGGAGAAPVEPGLLIALEHAGNYTTGAYDDAGRLFGVTAGFFGAPQAAMMHSHIAGVHPDAAGRGIGAAMKLHQRAWCLARGVHTMEWTFDPLITRNARFNLHKLGAEFAEYLPQFYGQMRDATNAGQGSDRALIRWPLRSRCTPITGEPDRVLLHIGDDDAPVATAHGADVLHAAEGAGVVGLSVHPDMMRLRRQAPELSAQWRVSLRETMQPLLQGGYTVRGVTGEGTYLLSR